MKNSIAKYFPALQLLLLCSGCVADQDSVSVSRDDFAVELRAFDWSGRPVSVQAMGRRPKIRLKTSDPIDGSSEPVFLFSGGMDDALIADLEKEPLRVEHRERVVPCRIDYADLEIALVPQDWLQGGETYTVAVAGWARSATGHRLDPEGSPFYVSLTVSADMNAGAQAVASWPADGATAVAPNLDFAAVRFDGLVSGADQALWIETAAGIAVPGQIQTAPCEQIGWEGSSCAIIAPRSPLVPSTGYRIAVGTELLDGRGAPVGPWFAGFQTAAVNDLKPPGWQQVTCALDEQQLPVGCALVDEQSIAVRARPDEPARLHLDGAGKAMSAISEQGEATLLLDQLPAEQSFELDLVAADLAGNQIGSRLRLNTTRPLATLSITEIRADPRGPEPAQEFIELYNWGKDPIDLRGFSISDDSNKLGQVIESSVIVQPATWVLLVADSFDPDNADDDPPLSGATLVRLPKALTGNGLSNTGAPLFLRDTQGRRISAAPAIPKPRAGVCMIRVAANPRHGSPGSFAYDPSDGCSPGK
jgi:hypothetical protein